MTHKPTKTLETEQFIVFDNFLSPEKVEAVYKDFMRSDFRYINTTNKVARAWKIRDGFPLRGKDQYYYAPTATKPENAGWIYPVGNPLDSFMEGINGVSSEVGHLVGVEGKDWQRYSVTQWIYQQGTGLSLHDDGSNVFAGAYTYFLTKRWNIHWGGMLLVTHRKTDLAIKNYRDEYGGYNFWAEKWANEEELESPFIEEPGYGQFIFPKFNRIVFIKNDALHAVTTINAAAGDRIRMSLAGFFNIRNDT